MGLSGWLLDWLLFPQACDWNATCSLSVCEFHWRFIKLVILVLASDWLIQCSSRCEIHKSVILFIRLHGHSYFIACRTLFYFISGFQFCFSCSSSKWMEKLCHHLIAKQYWCQMLALNNVEKWKRFKTCLNELSEKLNEISEEKSSHFEHHWHLKLPVYTPPGVCVCVCPQVDGSLVL